MWKHLPHCFFNNIYILRQFNKIRNIALNIHVSMFQTMIGLVKTIDLHLH